MLVNVDYHIIDKCNLKCVGCNHFCPLVPESNKPKSLELVMSDLSLLSKFKDHIGTLALLGGEPLLHPRLYRICQIARKLFPNNTISITTNGTLINRVREIKEAIREFGIELVISVYPIKRNDPYYYFNEIKKIIPDVGMWDFPTQNGMYINELSSSTDTSEDDIRECVKRWRCNQLKDGKLYICHYAAQLSYLKTAFPGYINIDENDSRAYLDLHDENLTIDQIYEFQRITLPDICFHCTDAKYHGYAGPCQEWRRSELKLDEWYR